MRWFYETIIKKKKDSLKNITKLPFGDISNDVNKIFCTLVKNIEINVTTSLNMEVNITLLEKHFVKLGTPVTTNVSIDTNDINLTFIRGSNHEGSTRIFLTPGELNKILVINNIICNNNSDNSLVKAELELMHNELSTGLGDKNNRVQRIENLIYGTLAKYIIQMLSASTGHIFFPEIVSLSHHKDYFRENI